jgi:hypothetical protein
MPTFQWKVGRPERPKRQAQGRVPLEPQRHLSGISTTPQWGVCPLTQRGVGCRLIRPEPAEVSACPGEAKRPPCGGQALTGHAKACRSDYVERGAWRTRWGPPWVG